MPGPWGINAADGLQAGCRRLTAAIVVDSDEDVFIAADDLKHDVRMSEACRVFEAKPGILGFTIDLIRGADVLAALLRRLGGARDFAR